MPDTRRIVLHIGLPKTGSSTIQAALAGSDEALAREGILYPVSGRLRGAHHPLAWALRASSEFPDRAPEARRAYDVRLWEEVRREIDAASSRVVVVSTEHFSLRNERDIARLAEMLPGWTVGVVAFRRPQRDLVPSWWQEEVKAGERESLAEALPRLLNDPITLVDPVLERWKTVFGAAAVSTAEVPEPSGADPVLREFCALADVASGWWRPDAIPFHNESLGWDHVEALRLLNLHLGRRCDARQRPYEEWKYAPDRRRLLRFLGSHGSRLPKPVLPDDVWRTIESGQPIGDDDLGAASRSAHNAGQMLFESYLRAERRWRTRLRRGAGRVRQLVTR